MNPYTLDLLRRTERARQLMPVEHETIAPPAERVQAFFAAMSVNHGGNRAKIMTAIAHTMSNQELTDALTRLQRDSSTKTQKLIELGAPECIVTNAERENAPAIKMLERVLTSRQLKPQEP